MWGSKPIQASIEGVLCGVGTANVIILTTNRSVESLVFRTVNFLGQICNVQAPKMVIFSELANLSVTASSSAATPSFLPFFFSAFSPTLIPQPLDH